MRERDCLPRYGRDATVLSYYKQANTNSTRQCQNRSSLFLAMWQNRHFLGTPRGVRFWSSLLPPWPNP